MAKIITSRKLKSRPISALNSNSNNNNSNDDNNNNGSNNEDSNDDNNDATAIAAILNSFEADVSVLMLGLLFKLVVQSHLL